MKVTKITFVFCVIFVPEWPWARLSVTVFVPVWYDFCRVPAEKVTVDTL
jgi:hypothetical protein